MILFLSLPLARTYVHIWYIIWETLKISSLFSSSSSSSLSSVSQYHHHCKNLPKRTQKNTKTSETENFFLLSLSHFLHAHTITNCINSSSSSSSTKRVHIQVNNVMTMKFIFESSHALFNLIRSLFRSLYEFFFHCSSLLVRCGMYELKLEVRIFCNWEMRERENFCTRHS